jgi:hypothetical protein
MYYQQQQPPQQQQQQPPHQQAQVAPQPHHRASSPVLSQTGHAAYMQGGAAGTQFGMAPSTGASGSMVQGQAGAMPASHEYHLMQPQHQQQAFAAQQYAQQGSINGHAYAQQQAQYQQHPGHLPQG